MKEFSHSLVMAESKNRRLDITIIQRAQAVPLGYTNQISQKPHLSTP